MNRRWFLGSAAAGGLALAVTPDRARAARHDLLVAEPVHSIGYLPMYVAMARGYFAEADIEVKVVTIETGAGHASAVLSGQAFAFIGGPEHCAFAKAKGGEMRTVVHCVDRGNVYFCAASPLAPEGRDFHGFVNGKTIATAGLGSTPNSITRYLLKQWNLDARRDVTLIETANSAVLATVKSRRAQIGCVTEPFITQGISQSVWSEPFFNVPKELGPYAYSTINVRLESVRREPEVVRGFVRGIMKALKYLDADRDGAAEIARRQFPTMPSEDLKATLSRSFADGMWSRDGVVSRAAWDNGKAVVMDAGILKTDVPYDDIIDMSFVEDLRSSI